MYNTIFRILSKAVLQRVGKCDILNKEFLCIKQPYHKGDLHHEEHYYATSSWREAL